MRLGPAQAASGGGQAVGGPVAGSCCRAVHPAGCPSVRALSALKPACLLASWLLQAGRGADCE